jgi:hypothetical protein
MEGGRHFVWSGRSFNINSGRNSKGSGNVLGAMQCYTEVLKGKKIKASQDITVFLFKTERFEDWILSSSSGGTFSLGSNQQN